MDRLNHLFPHYDKFPKLAESTLPDMKLDTSELDTRRETVVSKDKYDEIHIRQKKDGVNHIISLDKKEIYYVLSAIKSMIKGD